SRILPGAIVTAAIAILLGHHLPIGAAPRKDAIGARGGAPIPAREHNQRPQARTTQGKREPLRRKRPRRSPSQRGLSRRRAYRRRAGIECTRTRSEISEDSPPEKPRRRRRSPKILRSASWIDDLGSAVACQLKRASYNFPLLSDYDMGRWRSHLILRRPMARSPGNRSPS